MRRLPFVLVLLVSLALVWPLARRAASAPATTDTVRIATLNIHKGTDRRNTYHLHKTIEAIRRMNVDVIGLQEVMQNNRYLNCDDQARLITDGLRHLTGEPWTYVFSKAWLYEERTCMDAGRSRDLETEGLAILTRDRILWHDTVRLSEGRVGLAVRLASLPDIPIVVTHLSPNLENQALRVRELATLLPWAGRHGPGILMGDLNARPETDEIGSLSSHYRDAWTDAAAVGRISGVTSGSTRPGRRVSRIDYVLFAPSMTWQLDSAEIFDMATIPDLGEVSDHHAMIATFRRKSATPPTAVETR
jgi:endonuclease/exonuclease/phosphatase family metal-dependent hydrolase